MKTKKILAIVVSCLLLIGVAAGITASAADAPTVAVSEVNLSYEGAIRLLYTFDTENLAAGQTVKAVFSANADTKVADGKFDASAYDYVGTAFNMNGETAVYSGGISPTATTAPIYVIPVVTDSADNVVAVGEKVCFSIYDYCMARLGGEYTPEQYLLYLATLNFGGSIQKGQTALGAEKPANGYADEYYVLSVMNGDGSVTEYKYDEPTEISLKAPKGYNGKLFDSFVDNNGVKYEGADFNIYNFKLDKIGTTYIKFVYGDTEIGMDSLKATAGNSASLANPDTAVVVNGGAEYYLEADVTLTAGTVATLEFMADATTKIGTIYLTEANGDIAVTDGITSFTMKNDSAFRAEYVVVSATNNTGTIFYYVNNEFVAKTDVPSLEGTSNAGFASAVVTATAGEIEFSYADIGAKDGFITIRNSVANTVATFEMGEDGEKYLYTYKGSQNVAFGDFSYTLEERKAHAVFEAKMKLSDTYYSSGWRNYIDVNLQVIPGQYNVANPRIKFEKDGVTVNGGSKAMLTTPIADDGWFDLKIDVVSGSTITIYVNGEQIFSGALSNTNKLGFVQFAPGSDGSGAVCIKDAKFYTVD